MQTSLSVKRKTQFSVSAFPEGRGLGGYIVDLGVEFEAGQPQSISEFFCSSADEPLMATHTNTNT